MNLIIRCTFRMFFINDTFIFRRQKHRGPDYHGSYQNEVTGDLLVHERLAIMDLSCKHPFQGTKKDHQVYNCLVNILSSTFFGTLVSEKI